MRNFLKEDYLSLIIERFLAFCLVLILLLFGFLQGLDHVAFEVTTFLFYIKVEFLEAMSSVLGFILFVSVCSLVCLSQIFYQKSAVKAYRGSKSVAAIIPTYMDAEQLEISLKSLADLEIPVDIVAACEEDDTEGIEKCKSLSDRFEFFDFVVNDDAPGTKAGAINTAASYVDADAIFVFDADQEVKDGFISKALWLLYEKGYDVVQARVIPKPEGFLESICYSEALFMYVIPERVADFLTRYKVAGSRGTAMKKSTFKDMEGYNPDFLTEDMDFAFRCYEQGLKVKPLLSEACLEKAPHSLNDYWGQRKRWIKGHIEVFESRVVKLAKKRELRFAKSTVLSGLIPLSWLLMVTMVSKFLILFILGLDLLVIAALSSLILVAMIFRFLDRKYFIDAPIGFKNYLTLFGSPLVFPLYGTAAIKAIFEYIFRNESNWYRVEK